MGRLNNSSNTGISLTGRLDPGTRANCSPFQKNFSDTRFIRFAGKAGRLEDLLNGSRAGIESNLFTFASQDYSEVRVSCRLVPTNVWTWPSVVAVDAGSMQIQSWEGTALSRAETVLQGTTHGTVRGNWLRRKSIAKTRFPSQAVIINTNEKLKYQWVRKRGGQ